MNLVKLGVSVSWM